MITPTTIISQVILFIALLCAFVGCASNLTVSDSIIFPDAAGYEFNGYHFIGGYTYSGNYIPGANRYGRTIHAQDSIDGLFYLNLNPGFGYGVGMASRQLAAAISAQLFMLGADVTVSPGWDTYVTGNITTSGTVGLTCLSRVNRSFAVGPFWRKDRFEGLVLGDTPFWLREKRYFAYSFGLKGIFKYSAGSESTRLLVVAAGYNPKIESIFLSVGIKGFRIQW